MVHVRSSDLIHLTAESLFPWTKVSIHARLPPTLPPLQPQAITFVLCFYEFQILKKNSVCDACKVEILNGVEALSSRCLGITRVTFTRTPGPSGGGLLPPPTSLPLQWTQFPVQSHGPSEPRSVREALTERFCCISKESNAENHTYVVQFFPHSYYKFRKDFYYFYPNYYRSIFPKPNYWKSDRHIDSLRFPMKACFTLTPKPVCQGLREPWRHKMGSTVPGTPDFPSLGMLEHEGRGAPPFMLGSTANLPASTAKIPEPQTPGLP